MVRLKSNEVISNYALGVVGQYLTIWSNPYGSQCVVLINRASTDVNGIDMSYTNAIDLLTLAARKGYKVYPASAKPKKGWVFVIRANGHQFGHTGIFIADSDGRVWNTVETNVDNNWDSLSVGGPARRKVRYINNNAVIDPVLGVIGWIVGYFEMGQDTPEVKKEAKEAEEEDNEMFLLKNGKYGLALMTNNKMIGLSHEDSFNSFRTAGLKVVYVSDKDFLALSKGLKDEQPEVSVNLTQPKEDKQETVTVLADGINVREGSSTSTKIVGIVGKGSVLTVKNKVQADGATWLQVDYGTQLGYIMAISPAGLVYAK